MNTAKTLEIALNNLSNDDERREEANAEDNRRRSKLTEDDKSRFGAFEERWNATISAQIDESETRLDARIAPLEEHTKTLKGLEDRVESSEERINTMTNDSTSLNKLVKREGHNMDRRLLLLEHRCHKPGSYRETSGEFKSRLSASVRKQREITQAMEQRETALTLIRQDVTKNSETQGKKHEVVWQKVTKLRADVHTLQKKEEEN